MLSLKGMQMIGEFNYYNPLAVYACYLGLPEKKRFALADQILSDTLNQAGKDNSSKSIAGSSDSWTGDVFGHSDLHTRPDFSELFNLLKMAVFDYIDGLGVDSNQLDVYFTRSWAVKQEGTQAVALHDHSQSHISLCYYPKVHKDSGPFMVCPQELPNEFLPNLFTDDHHKSTGLIDPTNKHTRKHHYIQPVDDLLLVFPSKMFHQVPPNKDNNSTPRYSISSDLVCTVKAEDRHEHCLPPLSQWRKMEKSNE